MRLEIVSAQSLLESGRTSLSFPFHLKFFTLSSQCNKAILHLCAATVIEFISSGN